MLNFANPYYSYLFFVPILILLLYWWSKISLSNRLKKFGDISLINRLTPETSKYMPNIKIILQVFVLVLIIFMLCRPRYGEKEQIDSRNGNEIFIALDVSNSMLASSNDDPNGISRLNRAKLLLEKLIEKLDNDRVGLIVFAGDAYLQLPMTSDFISAKQYVDIISTEMVPTQGTAIADAIEMAMNAYTTNENMHKALILITDCEDHVGDAIEMAQNARKQSVQVNVIGLGTSNGAPIPINQDRTEFLTDYNGITVSTSLNEQLAQDIAVAGDGIYINGGATSALNKLVSQLDKLSKSELKTVKYKATAEQFPFFAWFALVVLLIDTFIMDKKIKWLKNIKFFTK